VLLLAVAVSGTRKQTKEQDPTGQPEALPALERHAADSLEQVRVASGANPLPPIDTAEADAAQPNTSRVHDPGEIVAFIESYAAAYRKADTTFLAPFYSDSITYFDRGVVGRAYVFKDKDAYFSRWPDIRIDTDSTLPKAERLIVTEKSDGVFDIEWRVLFTVSGRGQKRSGRALNRFTVARAAAQRTIIIGESSSVTERFD
jgi:ketosteroid isomerase-like protein